MKSFASRLSQTLGQALLALLCLALLGHFGNAQNMTARVVAVCGTVSGYPIAGRVGYLTVDVNGQLCSGATGGGGGGGGAVTIASGAVASGAYSSGSIASGAFASGALSSGSVASGAFASGSLAAGSMVDFLTVRGTKAPGTAAANATLIGCVYTAAGITLTDGQQAACQFTSTGGVLVSVANANVNGQATPANSSPVVETFNITNGSAVPAYSAYVGGNGSGATGGLGRGQIICDLHAFYTGSDNGSKTLVAGVSGRKTYICGWLLSTAASATTLTLFKGTDADCATSGAAIGPPYALLANDRVGVNSATWNGFVTATNADYVCVNAGAGNAHTAEIWYAIL